MKENFVKSLILRMISFLSQKNMKGGLIYTEMKMVLVG